MITNTKLYVQVVTLFIDDNNLDYLIYPTFRNINRSYFHSKMVIMIEQEFILKNINTIIRNRRS